LSRQEIRASGQAFRIRPPPGSCRLNSIVIRDRKNAKEQRLNTAHLFSKFISLYAMSFCRLASDYAVSKPIFGAESEV